MEGKGSGRKVKGKGELEKGKRVARRDQGEGDERRSENGLSVVAWDCHLSFPTSSSN